MKKALSYIYNFLKGGFKNNASFALYIFSRPELLMLIFKGIYLPQYLQYEWTSKFQINTFIDIGAHDGSVSKVINYISPQTAIFAFEPIKQKKSLIKSQIKSSNLKAESLALSDHIGSQNFYEYNYPPASSFLKPDHKIFKKNIHITKSYPVKITTLDRYFDKKKLEKPIFVKMDTEGTENLIIRGGQKLLKQVSLIIIETGFVKSRKNQCLFEDVYKNLTKLGFTYKGKMLDSNFYPIFGPMAHENSIFIKKGELLNYLQKED